jgi:hypothetical protein
MRERVTFISIINISYKGAKFLLFFIFLSDSSKYQISGYLQDQFQQTWHANIDTGSKALNYRLFKNKFEFENYFNILDDRYIFTFCRFRLNNHKLPIERQVLTEFLSNSSLITVFTVFRLLTDFVCLYNYEFGLSLCKIVRSSVILLLPLSSTIGIYLLFVALG